MPFDPRRPHTEAVTPAGSAPVPLKLTVTKGADRGVEISLERGLYRIGTDDRSDLVLTDRSVSSSHLLVEVLADSVRLTDNGSRNGSFLHGTRFSAVEARPGATIRLGRTELKVSARLEQAEQSPAGFGELVGVSAPMRTLFALLEKVAKSDGDVLIQGESGTGKELCAEALHRASKRAAKPFVVCDLAGITPSLFESELFGHLRGAFTGAQSDRAGTFERAKGGTVFLDEVGELPLEVQPRLLRALERRQVKRVGSNDYATVDLRVFAATHKELKAEVKAGRFREDLYHRLAAMQVTLPPLRERPDDIPLLVDHILRSLGHEPAQLSQDTRDALLRYSWPGNVRELRHAIARSVSLGVPVELDEEPVEPTARPASTQGLKFKEAKDKLVATFERDYLAQLLRKCAGNVSQAAREAGIDRVYLRKLLTKHDLEPLDFKRARAAGDDD